MTLPIKSFKKRRITLRIPVTIITTRWIELWRGHTRNPFLGSLMRMKEGAYCRPNDARPARVIVSLTKVDNEISSSPFNG